VVPPTAARALLHMKYLKCAVNYGQRQIKDMKYDDYNSYLKNVAILSSLVSGGNPPT